jgi:putative toxin-antitoxin system antitoxin component (TIGR02293 family)
MPQVDRIVDVLGGVAVLKRPVRSWADLENAVNEGLPKRALQAMAVRALPEGAPTAPLVYRVVPIATFKRRTRLTPEESARTERLARVVALAEGLWDEQAEARTFLNTPHPLLDRRTPLDVAGSELGARRVERLLQDVEHGLPL